MCVGVPRLKVPEPAEGRRVELYSGGNRLRLRLPLTSQNQASLRESRPLYDRSATAPLSPTRLVNTSRFWLTGSLSLTLKCSKTTFARDGYENLIPQHQGVARCGVVNFPDLVAVNAVTVTVLVWRNRFAAFRVSVIEVSVKAPFVTGNLIADLQRIFASLFYDHMKRHLRFFGKGSPVYTVDFCDAVEIGR